MTSSNQSIYSELSAGERNLQNRAIILKKSSQNQRKAHEFIQQEKYHEALAILQDVLNVRKRYAKIPPHICCIDVASVHFEMGFTLKEIRDYPQAKVHFYHAWVIYHQFLGPDHLFTIQSKIMWEETSSSRSKRICVDETCQTAPAA